MFPNLRAELVRQGIKMADFADRIGMSSQCFSKRMNGKQSFTYAECLKVKEALGVDIPLEILFDEAN